MTDTGHIPVLAREVVEALNLPDDALLVDATFGRGGHSRLCLQRLGPNANILALDRDPDAIRFGREQFADEPRLASSS